MTKCQKFTLCGCFTTLLVTVIILSTFSVDMLVFGEDNFYSYLCSIDQVADFESSGIVKSDESALLQYEKMFEDPSNCTPFDADKEGHVWKGHVDQLSKLNQNLFVYGFVKSPLGKEYEV